LPEPHHLLLHWRIVVDANAKDAVGDVFLDAGADVVWVTREFDEGFPMMRSMTLPASKDGSSSGMTSDFFNRFSSECSSSTYRRRVATDGSCSAVARHDSQTGFARRCAFDPVSQLGH
jgi:hypothetical protein